MTQELAIYDSFWYPIDLEVTNLAAVDCQGTPGKYAMTVCIFPGFLRVFRPDNGKPVEIVVTRARVELE